MKIVPFIDLTVAQLEWAIEHVRFTLLVQQGEYVKQWVMDNHMQGIAHPGIVIADDLMTLCEQDKISILYSEASGIPIWTAYFLNKDSLLEQVVGDTHLHTLKKAIVLKHLGTNIQIPDLLI